MNWLRYNRGDCPVCNGTRKDCRKNLQTGLIHCRDERANPVDYLFRGSDAIGFGLWAYQPEVEAWQEEKREEWRRQKQQERELFERQLAQTRAQLLTESERDLQIRKILAQLTLTPEHRQQLGTRGFTARQIEAGFYRSVTPWQKLSLPVDPSLAGVKRGGHSLLTPNSGIICPVPNAKGELVAWQLRLDRADNGFKYIWAAGERSRRPRPTSHLQNGELPLAVYQPATVKRTGVVGLSEGVGFKPHLASERLGIAVIGAAGGNFSSSPETLKAYLHYLNAREVILYPDAGSLVNQQVLSTYLRALKLVASWGYQVKVGWWGQNHQEDGDIDEISDRKLQALTYLSSEEFRHLGKFPEPDFEGATNAEEPDPAAYQQYIAWEQEQERIEESIAHNQFLIWLKAKLKGLSKNFKGFVTKEIANTEVKELPQTLDYHPDAPLPTPSNYRGRVPPRIKFSQGQRLEVLIKLKHLGWQVVWDKSLMGLGKSHDAGLLTPDPGSSSKIWYLDLNHRNVSTTTVQENYSDLNPRHEGMYLNGAGELGLARTPAEKEKAIVPSNCHLAAIFTNLKEKGWNFENENCTEAPNPICANCIHHRVKVQVGEKKIARCAASRGDGFGFRWERQQTLAQNQIRAHLASLPNPQIRDVINQEKQEELGHSDNYNYTRDIAFVEEASQLITGVREVTATIADFDSACMDLATKFPEGFSQLSKAIGILRPLLEGNFPQGLGDRFGLNHDDLLQLLGNPPEKMEEIRQQLTLARLLVAELISPPEHSLDVARIEPKWKAAAIKANKYQQTEAWHRTKENFLSVHCNWLEPFLRIWSGEPGSLRIYKSGPEGRLVITTKDDRATELLSSMGFVVLLDTTLDKQVTARILARHPQEIIEIEQKHNPLTNLRVIQVEMPGMKSGQWSPKCLERTQTLAKHLRTLHPDIAILGLKKYRECLGLEGWWWVANRGSNKLLGKEAIAALGTPQTNLGAASDKYRTLFGHLEGFEDYYRGLINAEYIQLIGRPRAHLYPQQQFTIYLVGSQRDFSFLEELGCALEQKNLLELCPAAATRRQADKWRLLEFSRQLVRTGEKLTQEALAQGLEVSQGWISKLFEGQTISWKEFRQLFQSLYRQNIGKGIFSPDQIHDPYLREWLELDPLSVARECLALIQNQGIKDFEEILSLSAPDTRLGILGILAGILCLGDKNRLLESNNIDHLLPFQLNRGFS